jgi:hypothetical protein
MTSLKLLNQGSYGCVYRPGITCKGNPQSMKFITKLEVDKNSSENEYNIGTYIRENIPLSNTMFAPILDLCPISISKIDDDTIKECDVIQKQETSSLYSNKIRYVGKDSLEVYLYNRLKKYKSFISQLLETHLYLINSFSKLIEAGVVHYDVKENNIIYDAAQHVPIIIDFGLSFVVDKLKTDDDYKNAFYVFATDYPPWCLEIVLISYIVQEKYFNSGENSSWMNTVIDVNLLLDVVDDFYKNNIAVSVISEYQKFMIAASKKKWRNYIVKNFSKKKGKFIVESLMQSWDTWDNYALCVIYLFFIEKTFPKQLEPYLQILIEYILGLPNERIPIGDFYNKIYSLVDMHFENLPTLDHGRYVEKYKTQVVHNSRLENNIYTMFFGKANTK